MTYRANDFQIEQMTIEQMEIENRADVVVPI